MYKRASIFVCASAVTALAIAGGVLAAGGPEGKEVRVAQGRLAHNHWSLKVQGRKERRCYGLSMSGNTAGSTITSCHADRRPPMWNRLAGITANNSASIELDVTRTRVRRMRLRIGHPRTDQPPEWIRVRTRRITRGQAHRARVHRNFRFAVLHWRGTLCVKRGILFDRKGDRIDDRRVPCEG